MGRTSTERANDYNRVYGVDWNLRFLKDLDWNTYAVRTRTPGRGDGQYAWRSSLSYEGNFFHWKSGLLQLGENFQSDLSYFRRVGTRKYILDTGVRPRSPWLRAHGIREIHPHVVWNYYENLQGHMNGKRLHSGLSIFFNNGGFVEWSENPEFQLITSPLRLSPAAPLLPAGGYGWNEHQLRLTTDTSRTLVANAVLIKGGLWSGDQRSANVTLTYQPSYRFRVAVGLQHTDADLPRPVGSFTTNFWTIRPSYSFTTNMFLDALLQYLSDRQQFNANVRFNLIHHPLSDLYVVYNEFKSAIQQRVIVEKLFPIDAAAEFGAAPVEASTGGSYLYEPDEADLLNVLVPKHFQVQAYRILLESAAAEHGARMAAMDGATRNAGQLIKKVTLYYNKTRQAAITKELMDIVGGAEALQ